MAKKHPAPKTGTNLQARLGAVIRQCRHQLGLTQEELAGRANMHRTYIADVERGVRNVTLRVVGNLAQALEISVGNLFTYANAPARSALHVGAEPAPKEAREILLVEHNAASVAATARAFKRARLANPLRIVRDGEAALSLLLGTGRHAKRKSARPSLILLNPDLPKMSGEEFLRRVKSDERTRDIPVVVLTTVR